VWGERIDKDMICKEEMGCYRKNKFLAQQIQKVINKVRREIRELFALVCLACCIIVYRRIVSG
jgi:hypothetical protein